VIEKQEAGTFYYGLLEIFFGSKVGEQAAPDEKSFHIGGQKRDECTIAYAFQVKKAIPT